MTSNNYASRARAIMARPKAPNHHTMPRCPARTKTGTPCRYPAGLGTHHLGHGTCSRHGGAWPQSEHMWRTAIDIARQQDMSPTDALISLVKVAMGRGAYVDSVLSELMRRHIAEGGDPLVPPADIHPWLKESRNERNLGARTAKAAVDAGVMQALAQRLDLEGALVADAVAAALDAVDLTPEQRMAALNAAQNRLMITD